MKNTAAIKWIVLAMVLAVGCCMLAIPGLRNKTSEPIQPTATTAKRSATLAPTLLPTQHVDFKGRLLLERFLKQGRDLESAGVYELGSRWDKPVESALSRPQKPIATSPDGHYTVVLPHDLQDRQTGKTLPLPMDAFHKDTASAVSADFSPDGERVAYSVYSETEDPALFILDLASSSSNRIYDGGCARYTSGRICDYLGNPIWLDSDTLMFSFHSGGMPTVIDKEGDKPYVPNRLAVMTRQGSDILTLEGPGTDIPFDYYKAGETIFFETLVGQGVWLDADELGHGIYEPHPLPSGILFHTLSPDGRYILRPGQPWRLFEVRTQKESNLGTSSSYPVTAFSGCLWSIDQASIACATFDSVLMVPISDTPGGVVFLWDGEERWQLLDWLP